MKRPIALSLSPNADTKDALCAFKTLLKPWVWKRESKVKEIEAWFEKNICISTTSYAVGFNSGRSALFSFLRALNLEKNDEVILQAFTCLVVPNAIKHNNLKPVYVDVDKTLNVSVKDLTKKISKRTRAVLVQHTFGVPADISAIQNIIKKSEKKYGHKIYLIEDCAHALGGEYKGKPLGSWGDVSFFSFGRDKIISSVFGGMLFVNNQKLQEKVREFIGSVKKPSRVWIVKQLLHPVLFTYIILPLYKVGYKKVTVGKIFLFILQKLQILTKPVSKNEIYGEKVAFIPELMPDALALLLENQIEKLDEYNKIRRKTASFYHKSLATNKDLFELPEKSLLHKSVWLRFPIFCESEKIKDSLFSHAKSRGVLLGNWYSHILDPKCDLLIFDYKIGTCKNAEKASRTIINLPTYPLLSKKDTEEVVCLIKQWEKLQQK